MTLKEKLFAIEAELMGNRITAFAGSFLVGGGVGLVSTSDFSNSLTYLSMWAVGAFLTGYTQFGTGTAKAYSRTTELIKETHKLDQDFFRAYMHLDADKKFTGYCQLQGMYLACRDYAPELIPEFKKLKKQHTNNILPNF